MSGLRATLDAGFDVVLEWNGEENPWDLLSALFLGVEKSLRIVIVPDMTHKVVVGAEQMKGDFAFAHILPDMPDNARRDLATALRAGAVDVLFVSPERFTQKRFVQFMQELQPGLFLIGAAQRGCEDELDYNPSYDVLRTLRSLFPESPFIAFVDRPCAGEQRRALTAMLQLQLSPEEPTENRNGEWQRIFPLFEQGKSLVEVADMVGKDATWCLEALLYFIQKTGRTNPFPWVEQPAYLAVAMVAGQTESNNPDIVLPILGDRVTEPVARLALAILQNRALMPHREAGK